MNNRNDYRSYAGSIDEAGYGSAVPVIANATPATRGAFLRKVYATLAFGVGISITTGVGLSLNALTNPESALARLIISMAQGQGMLMLFLAYIALTFMVGTVVRKRGINVLAYLFFTAFTGFFITPILLFAAVKTGALDVIWQALGLTVFAFGGLTGYVLVSGKDFSFIKGFIWTGFWILVGFMVVGFWVESWAYHMAITAVGLLVFAGFVLYDTSEIMHRYGAEDWVAGAFSLFIDFINMFIRILMLLVGRRE